MKESEKVKRLKEERIYFKKLAKAMVDELYSRERRRISNELFEHFEGKIMCNERQKLSSIIHNTPYKED